MKFMYRSLALFERFVLVVAVALSVAVTGGQVASRFSLGFSLSWAEELTRYCIVWMCFLGAGPGFRDGAHIAIDVLPRIVTPRIQSYLVRTSGAIVAAFGILIFLSGLQLTQRAASFGQTSSAMQLPMWIAYLPIPIGGVLLCFHGATFLFSPKRSLAGDGLTVDRIPI